MILNSSMTHKTFLYLYLIKQYNEEKAFKDFNVKSTRNQLFILAFFRFRTGSGQWWLATLAQVNIDLRHGSMSIETCITVPCQGASPRKLSAHREVCVLRLTVSSSLYPRGWSLCLWSHPVRLKNAWLAIHIAFTNNMLTLPSCKYFKWTFHLFIINSNLNGWGYIWFEKLWTELTQNGLA
jgi:hypothetical protein